MQATKGNTRHPLGGRARPKLPRARKHLGKLGEIGQDPQRLTTISFLQALLLRVRAFPTRLNGIGITGDA